MRDSAKERVGANVVVKPLHERRTRALANEGKVAVHVVNEVVDEIGERTDVRVVDEMQHKCKELDAADGRTQQRAIERYSPDTFQHIASSAGLRRPLAVARLERSGVCIALASDYDCRGGRSTIALPTPHGDVHGCRV